MVFLVLFVSNGGEVLLDISHGDEQLQTQAVSYENLKREIKSLSVNTNAITIIAMSIAATNPKDFI